MNDRIRAPLVALALSLGLIGTYLAFGGASYDPDEVADPCLTREAAILDERELFELIALAGLDGAACELQVSREELTIALASEEASARFAEEYGVDEARIEESVRAGLIRAVDDAAVSGRIDGVEESVLRQIAERAPVGPAIDALRALPGDDSIQGLLSRIAELSEGVELPSLGELPSLEELEQLLP